jgi:hypothetical protein
MIEEVEEGGNQKKIRILNNNSLNKTNKNENENFKTNILTNGFFKKNILNNDHQFI